MNDWRDLVPAPLAAPESPELRAARLRVITGCVLVAGLLFFFAELRASIGSAALPLLVAVATFSLVQGIVWVKVKNAADDAWLFRDRDDAA